MQICASLFRIVPECATPLVALFMWGGLVDIGGPVYVGWLCGHARVADEVPTQSLMGIMKQSHLGWVVGRDNHGVEGSVSVFKCEKGKILGSTFLIG